MKNGTFARRKRKKSDGRKDSLFYSRSLSRWSVVMPLCPVHRRALGHDWFDSPSSSWNSAAWSWRYWNLSERNVLKQRAIFVSRLPVSFLMICTASSPSLPTSCGQLRCSPSITDIQLLLESIQQSLLGGNTPAFIGRGREKDAFFRLYGE